MPDIAVPLDAVTKVQIADDEVIVSFPARLARIIKRHLQAGETVDVCPTDSALSEVRLPASLGARHTRATIWPAAVSAGRRDLVLIKALRSAHAMVDTSRSGAPLITQVPTPRYERRLLRFAFLAPQIQRAILPGRHPAGLRLEDLIRNPMPADWDAQQDWITAWPADACDCTKSPDHPDQLTCSG